MVTHATLDFYNAAEYFLPEQRFSIRHGQANPLVDQLLRDRSSTEFAILLAWNADETNLSDDDKVVRVSGLWDLVSEYFALPIYLVGHSDRFDHPSGLFVLNIPKPKGIILAQQLDLDVIVIGEKGQSPRIEITGDTDHLMMEGEAMLNTYRRIYGKRKDQSA